MVMLSSTSLLHGNCVFNRNNTVATQQGMKTYWLCKSYRISMCRARCITHQGRIISATGVHNHTPHMRNGNGASGGGTGSSSGSGNSNAGNNASSGNGVAANSASNHSSNSGGQVGSGANSSTYNETVGNPATTTTSNHNSMTHQTVSTSAALTCTRLVGGNAPSSNMFQHHNLNVTQTTHSSSPHPASLASQLPPVVPATVAEHHHTHHNPHTQHQLTPALPNLLMQQHHTNNPANLHQHGMTHGGASTNSVIQNIMHNPNLMHLPNAMLMQHHQQHQQHSPHHHLQLHGGMTPELSHQQQLMQSSPAHLQSPSNRSNHSIGHSTESPVCMKSPPAPLTGSDEHHHGLVTHNAAPISPAEIHSNAGGSAETSTNDPSAVDAQHQAHVIDSITISPGSGHNFKIENM